MYKGRKCIGSFQGLLSKKEIVDFIYALFFKDSGN
jgi:hypothetical protein